MSVKEHVHLILLAIALWSSASAAQAPKPLHASNNEFNTALGVECSHCHVPDAWRDTSKPPFAITRDMIALVDAVNDELAGVGFVTCATCHGGAVKPARQPGAALEAQLAAWPSELAAAPETQKITMAVYNVALGVQCDYCHSADWSARDKEPITMVEMMTPLFDIFPKFMPATARTQCYMCHKGATKPQ